MVATLHDQMFDFGLDVADTDATHVYLCSAQPTNYTEAITTYALGNATATVGAPADAAPDGRKVTVAAITGGAVTATDTATHFALVDATNLRLLAANALAAPQAVTSGNTFGLTAFDIRYPDPNA